MRLVAYIVLLCAVLPALAQEMPGLHSISGTVTDPSGAGIPNADVRLQQRGTSRATVETRTDSLGKFQLAGPPTGALEISVSHEGFASEPIRIATKDRPPAPLRIQLQLAGVHQAVTVSGSAAQVSTDSADNLDTVTMDRQALDSLPVFDQDYVSAMSQFLDAGSIGTNGVTLVVNGMEQRNIGVTLQPSRKSKSTRIRIRRSFRGQDAGGSR